MKKIYFNRNVRKTPWGGGSQFLTAMVDFLIKHGHKVVHHFENDIDVIFMIDPRYDGDGSLSINEIYDYKLKNPKTKILYRVNECDARKGTNDIDNVVMKSMNVSDEVVFISEWLQQYFIKLGYNKKSHVIYNGCDQSIFKPIEHNNEKIRLVTHHWSDNWMKGFDIYNQIDQFVTDNNQFEFTYIGRYNSQYRPKSTKLIEPLYGENLGKELQKCDIYVTASRYEPCGMHHIEGASCGLPVLYHRDGGAIVDVCKHHGEMYQDFDDFIQKLKIMSNDIDKYRKKIIYRNLDIEKCCNEFMNIIDAL